MFPKHAGPLTPILSLEPLSLPSSSSSPFLPSSLSTFLLPTFGKCLPSTYSVLALCSSTYCVRPTQEPKRPVPAFQALVVWCGGERHEWDGHTIIGLHSGTF